MTRILLIILALYIGYRFVFSFLLPFMRVSRQMKDQVRDFQNRMNPEQEAPEQPRSSSTSTSRKEGDYIDYEEVK